MSRNIPSVRIIACRQSSKFCVPNKWAWKWGGSVGWRVASGWKCRANLWHNLHRAAWACWHSPACRSGRKWLARVMPLTKLMGARLTNCAYETEQLSLGEIFSIELCLHFANTYRCNYDTAFFMQINDRCCIVHFGLSGGFLWAGNRRATHKRKVCWRKRQHSLNNSRPLCHHCRHFSRVARTPISLKSIQFFKQSIQ